ncbi:hypothetical protein [Actinacidiphila oryziradicis]|uniref:hypothetical protein n=1 Tax=Actinacidiphila oryziradicis TaxID=2571141 RepID=UPI00145DA893|nr:hypothetical protein [Actinacidiphila oryziradicis]
MRVGVRWRTGATDTVTRRRPHAPRTPPEAVQLIRELAPTTHSATLAQILNESGHRTAHQQLFTAHIVSNLRHDNKIPAASPPPGSITVKEATARLGISTGTVYDWTHRRKQPDQAPQTQHSSQESRMKPTPSSWTSMTPAPACDSSSGTGTGSSPPCSAPSSPQFYNGHRPHQGIANASAAGFALDPAAPIRSGAGSVMHWTVPDRVAGTVRRQAPKTWNSETCPAGQPVLAVKVSRT